MTSEPEETLPEHIDDEVEEEAAETVKPPRQGLLRFARMSGSSIAGRDAAFWVTDFLNAAYYRRPADERSLDDLRAAWAVLTTRWYQNPGRRLRVTDLPAFHRAFGAERFDTSKAKRGTLSRDQLLEGASSLIGDWFPDALADDARRGWGIAFETTEDRDAYDPGSRMALGKLGPLTPEHAPPEEQTWHTYDPVEVPSAEGAIRVLTAPETWPDLATEVGRFTPLRPGGLADQTFEIDVAAGTDSGRPIFTRGYVTITALVTPDDPGALAAWFDSLDQGLAAYGDDEPSALPPGAKPLVGFDLTTHQGHFMGSGHNRLYLYEHEGRAWVRAAGTWDPMPWHIKQSYRVAGRDAQHAFWGRGAIESASMLHQLALRATA
ncbi:MAG: hypothetical protein M3Y23_03520 [Actinomycetota bacterium]|nr:hypothetical protein [Actinomycetota bacterium]